MAKAARAKTAGKGKRRKAKRGPMKPWVKAMVLVLLFPFAALLLPTTLVIATMMGPTVVAYVTDRSREKHLAITVGLLNFAGTLPAIINLWSRGQSHPVAMDLIGDVFVWVVAYGAAGVGWAIFGFMPTVVGSYYRMTTQARIKGLIRKQKALIAEWGHPVAEGAVMALPHEDEEAEDDEGEAGDAEPGLETAEAELVQPEPVR
ncbi:hypothetical protein AAFN88_08660 [Pelagibius sp. CAU 1746]|uniref:hypothetical protein n=1 Tax=Pelagibius sp. CAU 1746 TaxID=3140370 RepID=UPI00325BC242